MKSTYISRRVGATLIDYTLFIGLDVFYIFMAGTRNDHGGYTVTGWLAMVPVGLWILYFVITEHFLGGTLGHQICKLRIISMNNNEVTFGQTLARRLCDALEISWCFGLVAFLIAQSSSRNQRLGDMLAKTRVVGVEDKSGEIEFDFEKTS